MDITQLGSAGGFIAGIGAVIHTVWQMRKVNGTPEKVDKMHGILAEFLIAIRHAPGVRADSVLADQIDDMHARITQLPPSVHKRR